MTTGYRWNLAGTAGPGATTLPLKAYSMIKTGVSPVIIDLMRRGYVSALALNGAPISGSALMNLAVAGYEYDTTLKADGIPLEPLVNSFAPVLRDQSRDLFR